MNETPEQKQERVAKSYYASIGFPDVKPEERSGVVLDMLFNYRPDRKTYNDAPRKKTEEYFHSHGMPNVQITREDFYAALRVISMGLTYAQQKMKEKDGEDTLKYLNSWEIIPAFRSPEGEELPKLTSAIKWQVDPPSSALLLTAQLFAGHAPRDVGAHDRVFKEIHVPGKLFNALEAVFLIAVQEGAHVVQSYRVQSGKEKRPLVSNYQLEPDKNVPANAEREDEAGEIVRKAAEDFKLGVVIGRAGGGSVGGRGK
jgi:hypothetical protein